MNSIEIGFFALAVLLPLVGGSSLLYFLSRGPKRTNEANEANKASDETGKEKKED